MARVNVHDSYDGTLTGWFDSDKAELFEEYQEWNGSNMISRATGSQWHHEELYRTAGGRWVLHGWSNVQGERERYEFVPDTEAREWLLAQGHDEAVKQYLGGVEDERGPGRPEIGPAVLVRLTPEILGAVDGLAAEEGTPRAEVIRRLLTEALATTAPAGLCLQDHVTTYSAAGAEHEAIQLPWDTVTRMLGSPHTGEPDEDEALVAALLAMGAPGWVEDAPGWVDEHGWGLIGPEMVRLMADEEYNAED